MAATSATAYTPLFAQILILDISSPQKRRNGKQAGNLVGHDCTRPTANSADGRTGAAGPCRRFSADRSAAQIRLRPAAANDPCPATHSARAAEPGPITAM